MKKIVLILIILMFTFSISFAQDTLYVGNTYTVIDSLKVNTCITGFALTATFDTSLIAISNIQKFGIFNVEIVNLFPGRIEAAFNQLNQPIIPICQQDFVLFSFDITPKKQVANTAISIVEFHGVNNEKSLTGIAESINFLISYAIDFITKFKLK